MLRGGGEERSEEDGTAHAEEEEQTPEQEAAGLATEVTEACLEEALLGDTEETPKKRKESSEEELPSEIKAKKPSSKWKQQTLHFMFNPKPMAQKIEESRQKKVPTLEEVQKEIQSLYANKYHRDDYVNWGRKGGRPPETDEEKLRKAQERLERVKANPPSENPQRQGGSWRQGKGKNVVWTAEYSASVGEHLRKEIKKWPNTTKGQQGFWNWAANEYAEGRNVKGDKETRKRVKKA